MPFGARPVRDLPSNLNFLDLQKELELQRGSYASPAEPSKPKAGQPWYDSANQLLKFFDNSLSPVTLSTGGGTVSSVSGSGGTTGLTLTGGPITTTGTLTLGGTLAIANGGTGSTSESSARTALGLAIGTNVQAWDSDLDTLAGLTATTNNFIVSVSSAWASRTPAQVKTTLSLDNVDNTSDATKNSATATLANKDLTSGTNTFPTLNQNTTGSAAKWTTARNLAGNSVDGSADVAFSNKFIVQGTTDTGLSGAQFLGALGTGIVKNTTTTGVLSIAVAGDFPTLNQNTTGSAATLTTARAIYGNNFDGSAALTQIIASTYGGTGNGFTKFSGPATSEKTFTLPNASATVLTDNALVTVAQGGTGAGTLTGILKGNGTSAFTAVTAPSGVIVGDTDTQTLSGKTFTSPLIQGQYDGWIAANETWTYASATTFTIAADRTGTLSVGDRIKLTQTTVKYFVITGVSVASGTTTVTVFGGSDYSLANASITSPYYSKEATPNGYPDWFNFSPAYNGVTSNQTGAHQIRVIGREATINVVRTNNPTSNATTFTMNLPITAATVTNGLAVGFGGGADNGAGDGGAYKCLIASAATTVQFFRNWVNAGWTATGAKGIDFHISYPI